MDLIIRNIILILVCHLFLNCKFSIFLMEGFEMILWQFWLMMFAVMYFSSNFAIETRRVAQEFWAFMFLICFLVTLMMEVLF